VWIILCSKDLGKAGTVINNSLVTNKRPESVSRGG
jgi:hypothetical protein